jgi:hypothetical protein
MTDKLHPLCIYTIRAEKKLASAFSAATDGLFEERQAWVTGHALLKQARVDGTVLPVFFADAVETGEILYWATIEEIRIKKGISTILYRGMRRFPIPLKRHLLIVQRTGKPISTDDIRPYRICITPAQLPQDAVSGDLNSLAEIGGLPTSTEFREYQRWIDEGGKKTVRVSVRRRCEILRAAAKQHFRSSDGLLRCAACNWHRPVGIVGDIVELHHGDPLFQFPATGRKVSLEQAIQKLAPLCPNCHRIAHAHLGDGCYTLEELRAFATT